MAYARRDVHVRPASQIEFRGLELKSAFTTYFLTAKLYCGSQSSLGLTRRTWPFHDIAPAKVVCWMAYA